MWGRRNMGSDTEFPEADNSVAEDHGGSEPY